MDMLCFNYSEKVPTLHEAVDRLSYLKARSQECRKFGIGSGLLTARVGIGDVELHMSRCDTLALKHLVARKVDEVADGRKSGGLYCCEAALIKRSARDDELDINERHCSTFRKGEATKMCG